MVAVTTPAPTRIGVGGVLSGAVGALVGHGASVAVAYFVGWLATGGRSGDDLEAGGRFAVAFWWFMTLGAAEFVLFFGCLVVGAMALRRSPGLAIGLLAGWAVGVLLLATAVGVLFYLAGQPA